MTKTIQVALATLLFPALLSATTLTLSVDFTAHPRENIGSNTSGLTEYKTGSTNRVGGAGSSADRFVDNAVLGFNLPTFGSFSEIESAEFAVTLTGKAQQAGYNTDLYLFNSGVTPSALPAGDVMWNTDGEDVRVNVVRIMATFTDPNTANNSRPMASLTSAQLEGFYNENGTPTQTTIWFRMNLDKRTVGTNRYEFNVSGAELTVIPEPRVYAALFGMFALGVVFYRRRFKQADRVV